MNYQETLAFIHSRPRLHRGHELTWIKTLLAALDHPERHGQYVHITGTNGKGSVATMTAAMLQAAGLHVGRFISPYITRFNERFQVDGMDISDDALAAAATHVAAVLAQIQKTAPDFAVTEFEFVTALGYYWFAQQHVDVAVIEVGIGGAHDKTNVIQPAVSAITTVGADHLELIGPTLNDVAQEKSGVIKPHTPVVLGAIAPAQTAVITAVAAAQQAPVYRYGQDFSVQHARLRPAQHAWQFDYVRGDAGIAKLRLPSISEYEVQNAAVAITVSQLYMAAQDHVLTPAAVQTGLSNFRWPGRMELLQEAPYLMLDGAHNVPAAKALITSVKKAFPGVSVHLIAAFLKDKDVTDMLALYQRAGWDVTGTDFPDARLLALTDWPATQPPIPRVAGWQRALAGVLQSADAGDLILMAGSLHFVSLVRNTLLKEADS
ncbi:bifunctional folylpolyglutamate synthase/dihydrofolate synthase [Schleiferilactobacillus shenzhenensis]|uniref:tetrahydrofolate synthase n=1 Tax=Schleiferilactobacillus shenzhenensis LY-73 TaxID=1231336 RepID=U4TYS0_9LACO|nr:Mur ligase family protein [Schleiferilactobacillus shenzhenensis]ERL66457.1 Fgs [Schleiferilactobacillus shenzhenensis LY-73]